MAAAVAVLGCGEKDEPAGAGGSAAIAEGDAICAESQERIAELRRGVPATPRAAAELTAGIVAAYEDEVASLRALAVPAEAQADLDRYLSAREAALENLREGLAAARRGDELGYAEAQAAVARGQLERTRLAEAVGFERCSVPLSGAPSSRSR